MNHLDLFSGIGGFALAAQIAGVTFDHSYHSDIAPYANRVYQHRYPDSVQLGDVRKVNGKRLREQHTGPWIVTGGFPCQDISTAGAGRGLNSGRSGLWFEMLRVIGELQPSYAVIENVSALRGNGLDRVLISLASIGYDAEWQTISAKEVGAPHVRQRIWITAYPSRDECNCEPLWTTQAGDVGNDRQSSNGGYWHTTGIEWEGCKATRSICDQPLAARVDDGIPTWMDRGRGLGNAIVPQVAALIFNQIRKDMHR